MTFRFRPALTIATLIALAILVSLGTWQLRRLEWKRDLIAQVEARVDAAPIPYDEALRLRESDPDTDFSYTPVELEGRYAHNLEAHVFGTLNGEAGYYVFTPLRIDRTTDAGDVYVYVNRGFAPQRRKGRETRDDGLPEGEVVVRGLLRETEPLDLGMADFFRPENDREANIWHERRTARFADDADIVATPDWYVDSFGVENPGEWPKGGATRLEFSNRHFEYALTWFGLAAALLSVYGFYSFGRKDASGD
ncbi:MAG: SURF1 family protein [Pseudomonadota bacterium]